VTVLETRALSGGYGPLTVFTGVDLTLTPETVTGILGPNGAGKTTLLKTLAGLLAPHDGSIHLDGRDIAREPVHWRARHGVALVPEGRQIFASLTVAENLGIPRAGSPLDGRTFAARLDEILALFPRLRERLRQPGGLLSGGEQQMLAIARALLLDPQVLMLDEPTQGLAPVMVAQVLACLQGLRGRFAMLVVEQNLDFLTRLAGRTYTLRAGQLTAAS
jgi:ABC-type branched-subunit amino acid transport system ATPase component